LKREKPVLNPRVSKVGHPREISNSLESACDKMGSWRGACGIKSLDIIFFDDAQSAGYPKRDPTYIIIRNAQNRRTPSLYCQVPSTIQSKSPVNYGLCWNILSKLVVLNSVQPFLDGENMRNPSVPGKVLTVFQWPEHAAPDSLRGIMVCHHEYVLHGFFFSSGISIPAREVSKTRLEVLQTPIAALQRLAKPINE
jgi:hypothetical protein